MFEFGNIRSIFESVNSLDKKTYRIFVVDGDKTYVSIDTKTGFLKTETQDITTTSTSVKYNRSGTHLDELSPMVVFDVVCQLYDEYCVKYESNDLESVSGTDKNLYSYDAWANETGCFADGSNLSDVIIVVVNTLRRVEKYLEDNHEHLYPLSNKIELDNIRDIIRKCEDVL